MSRSDVPKKRENRAKWRELGIVVVRPCVTKAVPARSAGMPPQEAPRNASVGYMPEFTLEEPTASFSTPSGLDPGCCERCADHGPIPKPQPISPTAPTGRLARQHRPPGSPAGLEVSPGSQPYRLSGSPEDHHLRPDRSDLYPSTPTPQCRYGPPLLQAGWVQNRDEG